MVLRAAIKEAGYGKKVVLRDIEVEVSRGEIVSIIGPNGSGKSTFLKVVAGVLAARQSEISLQGVSITDWATHRRVRAGLAFVPQRGGTFGDLTVLENLRIGGYTLSNAALSDRISGILEHFPALRSRLRYPAQTLSGGEKQQLAVARALMPGPELLLLDEPSLGLAVGVAAGFFDALKVIASDRSIGVVLVEQKVQEALRVATRVYALKLGRVVSTGTPEAIGQEQELRKIFWV